MIIGMAITRITHMYFQITFAIVRITAVAQLTPPSSSHRLSRLGREIIVFSYFYNFFILKVKSHNILITPFLS